jgi:subtilisin family serine protease
LSVRFTLDDPSFRACTGSGVTVAVLDSGVHAEHPHVGGVQGGTSLALDDYAKDLLDRVGHGTAVAAAIREKSPAVSLLVVKIFHQRLATNADVLARAIRWAADKGAQLINLSLGTTNAAHAERLTDATAYALELGAVVVSAREVNGVACLPGSLPNVVGVVANDVMDRMEIDARRESSGLIVRASPFPRPIPNVPRERNLSGVSFAVANTTGFLARAVERANGDAIAAIHALG